MHYYQLCRTASVTFQNYLYLNANPAVAHFLLPPLLTLSLHVLCCRTLCLSFLTWITVRMNHQKSPLSVFFIIVSSKLSRSMLLSSPSYLSNITHNYLILLLKSQIAQQHYHLEAHTVPLICVSFHILSNIIELFSSFPQPIC